MYFINNPKLFIAHSFTVTYSMLPDQEYPWEYQLPYKNWKTKMTQPQFIYSHLPPYPEKAIVGKWKVGERMTW